MNNKYIVYCHTFPNGKRYVGMTCQKPNRRWRNGRAYVQNKRLYNAINKYGWENINHEILFDNLTREKAERIEQILILLFGLLDSDFGYNYALGGSHPRLTEETKKKISESGKGKHNRTEEYKLWISQLNSGPGNYMFGKHHTEETKRKISETKKGNSPAVNKGLFGGAHPSAKPIEGRKGQEVVRFGSIIDASKQLGICNSCLQAALHGQQKTAGGYRWRYV